MRKTAQAVLSRLEPLRCKAKAGDRLAAKNLAAEYRILGKRRLAFWWWKKGADAGDGDNAVEVGYCYQHGIGVRRDVQAAARSYESASRSRNVTPYGKEEARYLLAVLLLASGQSHQPHRKVIRLLKTAAADRDYPQAQMLLAALRAGSVAALCFCRRGLRRSLGGSAYCPLHQATLPNHALNPSVLRVTALAKGSKRRAARPAG